MTPFQRVLDRLMELIPTLIQYPTQMVKATNLIEAWLRAGCDVDLDILPAINSKWVHTPTGIKVTSAAYFDRSVIMAMEKRTQTATHKQREEESLAHTYAWKRARGFPLSAEKLKHLEAYEATNGPIVIPPINRNSDNHPA